MRQLRASLGILPLLVLTAQIVRAQTTTGTIVGRVLDEQGFSLPGVTVNVESASLQGARSMITSGNGDYIVGLLPPGVYTLSFQLTGFEHQRKMVTLAPTQTLPLDVTLGVARVAESIVVQAGSSATVLTQTPQVATNFQQDMIAKLPTNRDINVPILMAPGVHASGPGGAYSFAGAMSFESLFMVNGVTINENLRGQPNNLYIEDAIQETTVATDGISAEYGRFSGGLVNIITKSGGNLFSGSFRDTLNNDAWRPYVTGDAGHPFTGDCPTCGPGGGPSKVNMIVPQYEYVFGGPIMKDRIWFFTAGRLQNQSFAKNTAVLGIPYVAENKRQRYEAKVTASVNSNHRFESAYVNEALTAINDSYNSAVTMDLASLITRKTPQHLASLSYDGQLSPSVSIEARAAVRRFTFINSGARSTDSIDGTLMIDPSHNGRFWAPTFCGVCGSEKRDNDNAYVKVSFFKPTKRFGTHQLVAGYDTFDDNRFANNRQSGSDYRISVTTTKVLDGVIYPQLLNTDTDPDLTSTWLRYNPVTPSMLGTSFRTHALFFNDNWRLAPRVTLSLGVRYDKNHGLDSAGNLVAHDSAISPRLGVVWDATGDGRWSLSASASRYVAAVNGAIADLSSAAGSPATFQWNYVGPSINPDLKAPAASLVPTAQAIQQVFNWCDPDARGLCRNGTLQVLSVPGISVGIPNGLTSPNVMALAGGVSRQFQNRGVVRVDYSYRDYRDFYSQRIDLSTGTVTDQFGDTTDLAILGNTNQLKRRYSGVTVSATYHADRRLDLGGNYTLSRLWGNFDGENSSSGPLASDIFQYPEYRQMSWYAPEGDLSADQRHRSTMWLNYEVPKLRGLIVSVLEEAGSGLPYGAVGVGGGSGAVNATLYVPNPGYASPLANASETYYYTARDAFRTEGTKRTDVAINYGYSVGSGIRKVDLFFQAQILNIFNTSDLCGCGAAVFGNGGASALSTIGQGISTNAPLVPFNPFTTVPVEGVNWSKSSSFGQAINRLAFTSPPTLRLSFGVRF
jgi:hypothetical protein